MVTEKATDSLPDLTPRNGQLVREKLLDAALRLFARHGFKAPLRTIAADADTNLGAIRYYFGSKDDLIKAVFDRFAEPLNRERLIALNAYEKSLVDEKPNLEKIVRALVEPTIRLGRQPAKPNYHFFQLINLVYALRPPAIIKIMREEYDPMVSRFIKVFAKSLPHLSEEALLWRYVFMMGAVVHAIVEPEAMQRIERLSRNHLKISDADRIIEQLIPFLVGGLMAPASATQLDKGQHPVHPHRRPRRM